jgi:hypothetical protein
MIAAAVTTANLCAAVCSALAAYHWRRAAQVKEPPETLLGSFGWDGPAGVDASPLVAYARESGRRNKTAAWWSAATAACAFAAWALQLFLSPG